LTTIYIFNALYRNDFSFYSFLQCLNLWGTIIGVLSTGLIAALIPSRVDKKIEKIVEELQDPLTDFKQIFEKALSLLEWLNNEEGSKYFITSATPIFGIELDKKDRDRWEKAIKKRINHHENDSSTETSIYCLDWKKDGIFPRSPLFEFCKELEKGGLLAQTEDENGKPLNKIGLFKRSLEVFRDFSRYYSHKGFNLLCGPRPPLQVVLATNAKGESKGVIYFTTKRLKNYGGHNVSGFATQDHVWIDTITEIKNYLEKQGNESCKNFIYDSRTPEQNQRCLDLVEYQLENSNPRDQKVRDINVKVYPGVFPPEYGIMTTLFIDSIRIIKTMIRKNYKFECIGIDVGTGTGILALELAKYCNIVYATDLYETCIQNAKDNLRGIKYKYKHLKSYEIVQCNLLQGINKLPDEDFIIVVFNYPLYNSPLKVYNPVGKAGKEILNDFFEQISGKFADNKVIILLPYSDLSGEEQSPLKVSIQHGFKYKDLYHKSPPTQYFPWLWEIEHLKYY
jgi:methylase of polypeptide subunit release factors